MDVSNCNFGNCEGCSHALCYWAALTTGDCMCLVNTSGIPPNDLTGMVRPGKFCGTFSSYFCANESNMTSTESPIPTEVNEGYLIATEALGVLLGATLTGAAIAYWRRGLLTCSARGWSLARTAALLTATRVQTVGGASGRLLQGLVRGAWAYVRLARRRDEDEDSSVGSLNENEDGEDAPAAAAARAPVAKDSVACQTEGWDNPGYDYEPAATGPSAGPSSAFGGFGGRTPERIIIVPQHLNTPTHAVDTENLLQGGRVQDNYDGPARNLRSHRK